MSITSDEVNLLIYHYLQQSGFQHSAFTFGNESMLLKSSVIGAEVPHGCLISYLQKGLQYKEIETHVHEDGTEIECDEPFSILTTHVCRAKKKLEKVEKDADLQPMDHDGDHSNDGETDSDITDSDVVEIPQSHVTTLQGHESEVFICAWSPTSSLLASGSGDSTARIWTIPAGPCGDSESVPPPTVLKHNPSSSDKSKDVTTLDWNGEGTLLATGSYDGLARIWTSKGELTATLNKHSGPIFSLKWNKKGDYLLSGSVDKTAIIWDAKSGQVLQQFDFHTAPTLDVDWRNNTSFATCSTDKAIYVCELGKTKPLRSFAGHQDEVNAIKWDPSGTLLASCSDDYTAKIWSIKNERCVHDFREHTKEIYTIKWSPTGPNSENPHRNLVLASASFDATIKVWDAEIGTCLYNLTKHSYVFAEARRSENSQFSYLPLVPFFHCADDPSIGKRKYSLLTVPRRDPVYSVAFSPNGEYLASGSFDRCLHIWSVRDGSLVKTYRGSGGIFEVCWNNTGDKVASCFSNNTVCVIDFRM